MQSSKKTVETTVYVSSKEVKDIVRAAVVKLYGENWDVAELEIGPFGSFTFKIEDNSE